MKSKKLVVATALFCTTLFASPFASAASIGESVERAELSDALVQQWAGHASREFKITSESWAAEMAPAFRAASMDELRQAAKTMDFDGMNRVLLGGTTPAGADGSDIEAMAPKALGDSATDLVFVPISPCRILDTRVAGGAIAANTTRGVDVTAVSSYSFQGGASSDCGGAGNAGSFAAVAVNLTVVNPSGAGYITAYPVGTTQPTAATVNYAAGAIVGNLAIVRLDQGSAANEMNIYSFAQTHVVGDIVGYFINPQATALDCVDTAPVVVSVNAGSTANASSAACPAGYTPTATNCESTTWQMPFVFFKSGTCSAQNNSASTASLRASRTCCRVPGR